MWEVPGRQLAGVRVAVLGWDSGGGSARILGKGGNLLRECGGARGFYLHVKHFSWISSVAVSPVYRPAHPRVWPGQTVCWRQPPHISPHWPLERPPRGQGRRATGRPSPPWSRKRAAPPDQHRVPLIHPSPTSSSSRGNARPLRRSRQHLRRPRRRPDGDEVSHGSPRWVRIYVLSSRWIWRH